MTESRTNNPHEVEIQQKLDELAAKIEKEEIGSPLYLAFSDQAEYFTAQGAKELAQYEELYAREKTLSEVRLMLIQETIRQREDTIPGYYAAKREINTFVMVHLYNTYNMSYHLNNASKMLLTSSYERTRKSATLYMRIGDDLSGIRENRLAKESKSTK